MAKKTTKRKAASPLKPKCGLVMPIASTPNCPESHWREVKEIFVSALKSKFETELVSEEPEVDVIQSKIVNNLYDNPLVVVDVSELNPNVMFELGLRLAFDKPTILVKDNETDWKFDISPLETLVYPRDLRHAKIENFKGLLAKKALATHEKREAEGEAYSQYLKHFKKLERKTIETEQVGDTDLILNRINDLESIITSKETSTPRLLPKQGHFIFKGAVDAIYSFKNYVETSWEGACHIVEIQVTALGGETFLNLSLARPHGPSFYKSLETKALSLGLALKQTL